MTPQVAKQLYQLSASTIDRLLRPHRHLGTRRPFSTTKPGSLLKASTPIRTFSEWNEDRPGFLEVDLVAHCGESTEGLYLNTLTAVDVATGWVECQPVWGKGQDRVGGAVHRVGQRLPFPFLGLDSDNGSEFINHHLYTYCQRKGISFTRSRPYKKNDSAHVEQKNWSVVKKASGIRQVLIHGRSRSDGQPLSAGTPLRQLLSARHEATTQDTKWCQGPQGL